MKPEFWNSRYADQAYAYGKEANDFLKTQLFSDGEKVLCLAEGEGRNAVWIAAQGADVTALDYSEAGLQKAEILAAEKGVRIRTVQADLSTYQIEPEAWDSIVCIFGHFEPELRERVLRSVRTGLKTGGRLIMEVYAKEQLAHQTGGPSDINMLYSADALELALEGFASLHIEQTVRYIREGRFHEGMSSVIQVLAVK